MRVWYVVALLCAAFSIQCSVERSTLSSDSERDDWSIDDVRRSISESNNAEEFLQTLLAYAGDAPLQRSIAEGFGRFLLVYDSDSLHYATPREPRVILYNTDVSALVAFSGSVEHALSIEVIWLDGSDPSAPRWRFAVSDFGSELSESRDCQGCHHSTPNWAGYKTWTGIYGSETGLVKAQEMDWFRDFEEHERSEGLYRYLRGGANDELLDGIKYVPRSGESLHDFTSSLVVQNNRVMAAELSKLASAWVRRYAVLNSLACLGNRPSLDGIISLGAKAGLVESLASEEDFREFWQRLHEYQSIEHEKQNARQERNIGISSRQPPRHHLDSSAAIGALSYLLSSPNEIPSLTHLAMSRANDPFDQPFLNLEPSIGNWRDDIAWRLAQHWGIHDLAWYFGPSDYSMPSYQVRSRDLLCDVLEQRMTNDEE